MQLQFHNVKKENSDVMVGGAHIDDETLVFTGITTEICAASSMTNFRP